MHYPVQQRQTRDAAVTSETQTPFKDVALLASFTDRALTADAALVDGVSHQCAAPTELSPQLTFVD
jgi:hypothetical protein